MKIQYDAPLNIAVANSRKAKAWKNHTMLWSEILERMEQTTRTPETVAEYRKMGKNQQADIKDVGAIVGGYCNNGSRSDIRHRSILALDADFADAELWEDFLLIYGNAAALYSTHKHTPEKPRFRLMLPLARTVTPDEYQAIGRRIAYTLGIDKFDDSTYQPQRCMFWPSTSQDGEYVFRQHDAKFLDPDEVLSTYVDWRDVSAWPMSSRITEVIKREANRQADPTEKSGLIGAFCRAYTIEEAIETFVTNYTPCSEPGRYTYAPGSTAGGVITYEGKFSYSFHGTDPASGQLVNAWDLVRIHLFGERDADAMEKAVNQRPSWQAMTELVRRDAKVKQTILSERSEEFDDSALADSDWQSKLKFTNDGSVASTIENTVIILTHDPKLAGRLVYDEFANQITSLSSLPWRAEPGAWADADDAALRLYLETGYGISGKDKIYDAVNCVAARNRIHPVRDYLKSCDWDGVARVDTLLVDYLGAEDSPYTRAVTRKSLVAAVARIFQPGVKFDYMLTIQGKQGLGKSAIIKKLGGKWFSDSFMSVQGKDAFEQIQGAWLVEVGELAGMRKAEAEATKLYISKQVDRYRPAYGRRPQEFPRQCVFFGTTNESQFLRDATGNRRYWVVATPNKPERNLWDELTPEVVTQIWGEAVQMYHAGEELFLPRELAESAEAVQASYEEENPLVGLVMDYLDRLLPENWDSMDVYERRTWLAGTTPGTVRRETVSYIEIYAEVLNGSVERVDRYEIKKLSDAMTQIPGWVRAGNKVRTVHPYGRQRYFRREDGSDV